MAIEVGSLADWASAVGSFVAVITALYLSGSERRAARAAQRPEITLEDIPGPDATGWTQVNLIVSNHSNKHWVTRRLAVLRPRGARIVETSKCYDDSTAWDPKFDANLRDQRAKPLIDLQRRLRPAGSIMMEQHADRCYVPLYLKIDQNCELLRLQITLESLEPVPDNHKVIVVRTLEK